jgi:L-rhamnose-H+ transport protein
VSALTVSILVLVLAGFLQGTFGLGMKKFAPLAWEAYWLVFSIAGMIVIPALWATATVAHPWGAIGAVEPSLVLKVMLYGACWGVGAIMFGMGVNYVGMTLTNGIAMGLAAALGSLVPMMMNERLVLNPATLMILLANLVMVIGVAIATWAGIGRDRLQAVGGKAIAGIQTGRLFWLGLVFCIASGVASAMLNIGNVAAEKISQAAVKAGEAAVKAGGDLPVEALETLKRNASILPWVVIFWGGAIVNIIYVLFLLVKNRSFHTYRARGAAKGVFWALATALLWFFALAAFGQGKTLMGPLGNVVGWPMFLALALVVSNVWGILSGEWKDSPRPLATMLAGSAVLVASAMLLGYANSMPSTTR